MCARYDAVPSGSEPQPTQPVQTQTTVVQTPTDYDLVHPANRYSASQRGCTPTQTDGIAEGVPIAGNQHNHRVVSQSVPSGTVLHPCARRNPTHRTCCRQSVPSVQLSQSRPNVYRRSVPTVGNSTLHGTSSRTPTTWHHIVSRVHRSWYRRCVPSVSRPHLKELTNIVKRYQSFLLRRTRRQKRSTHRGCKEEGGCAIPLPPMKPPFMKNMKNKPLNLRDTQPTNRTTKHMVRKQDAPNPSRIVDSKVAVDMLIEVMQNDNIWTPCVPHQSTPHVRKLQSSSGNETKPPTHNK